MARRKQVIANTGAIPQGQAMKQRKLSICYHWCYTTAAKQSKRRKTSKAPNCPVAFATMTNTVKEVNKQMIFVPECRSEPRGETQALRAAHTWCYTTEPSNWRDGKPPKRLNAL